MTTSSVNTIDLSACGMSNDDSMKSLENLNDNSPGFEDKEMQIKIIHQNTEITNLPSCRPPSQSSLIIDSETPKRFIMVDQKLRLPTELRETFKFIGKDERGYYKYLAPFNTVKGTTNKFKSARSQTKIVAAKLEDAPSITLKTNVINKCVPLVPNSHVSSDCLSSRSSIFPNFDKDPHLPTDPSNIQLSRFREKGKLSSTSSRITDQRANGSQTQSTLMYNTKENDMHFKTRPKLKNLKVLLRRLPMIPQAANEINGQPRNFNAVADASLNASNPVKSVRTVNVGSLQPINPISIKTPSVLIVQQPLEKFNPLDLKTSEGAEKYKNSVSRKAGPLQESREKLTEGRKCNEVQTDLSFEGVCGLVDTNHFHLNCFYCSAFYHLERWPEFLEHVKYEHNIEEKAFSLDHDYAMLNNNDIKKDCSSDYDEADLNELYNHNLPSPMHAKFLHHGKTVNESHPIVDFSAIAKRNILDIPKSSKTLIKADNFDYFFKTCKSNVTNTISSEVDERTDEDYPMDDFCITSNNSLSPFTEAVDFDNDTNGKNFKQPLKDLLIKDSLSFAKSLEKSSDDETRSECNKDEAAALLFSEDDSFGDELICLEEGSEFLEISKAKTNDLPATQDICELSNEELDAREEYEIDQSEDVRGDSVSSTPNDIEISDDEMPSNDENEDDVPKPSRGCGILFGLTNRSVVIEFLENLKKYPVLYSSRAICTRAEYDVTIMKMCSILNKKYHLDITDFEMRHSIQRVNDWFSRTAYKMRKHERNIQNEPFKHRFPKYFQMCEKFLERTRLPYNVDLIKNNQDAAVFRRFNQNCNYPPWVKYTVADLKKRNCQLDTENSNEVEANKLTRTEESLGNISKTNLDNARRNSIVIRKAITMQERAQKQPEQGEYKCDQCGREYTLWRKFRAHKYTHLPPKFKCGLCEKMFTRNYFLQKHIETIHCTQSLNTGVKPKLIAEREEYKCDECGKMLYRKNAFRQHKLRHQPPQYQCKKCEKMFYSKGALDNHNHSSRCQPAPYICEFCGKAIYSRSTFRIHKKTKHFNIRRWYTCVVCNHKSQYQRYLLRHQQRHHLAQEGTLEELARRTNPQGMRLVHFSEEYRKGYLWRNSLRRPGEKVYSCLTCHVVFERYKDVLHHNKEKHPIRHGTYKCELCPSPGRLLMRSSLRRHYTSMHKVAPEELEVWVSRTQPVLPPTSDSNGPNPNDGYLLPIVNNEERIEEERNAMVLIEQIEDNDTVNSMENEIKSNVDIEETDFDDLVVEIIESEEEN